MIFVAEKQTADSRFQNDNCDESNGLIKNPGSGFLPLSKMKNLQ